MEGKGTIASSMISLGRLRLGFTQSMKKNKIVIQRYNQRNECPPESMVDL